MDSIVRGVSKSQYMYFTSSSVYLLNAEKGPQWRGLREHERASTFSEVLCGQGDHQHLELSCGILGVVSHCSFD